MTPNPTNGPTILAFHLARPEFGRLSIFDPARREVARLAEGELRPGRHAFAWTPDAVPQGIYLYELALESGSAVGKIQVVR